MRSAWILAAAVSATLTSFGMAADTTAPDTAAMKAQIELLQQQITKIEAQQAAQAQVQASQAAVAADAAKQSQLLQTAPFTAGYNNGFKIQSTDGNFVMQPGLVFQFRNIANYNSTTDDVQDGFEFRRLRPRLDGTAFDKNLAYSIVLDTGRNVGTISLLDAWVKYSFDKEWSVKLGQFRNSWVHEGDVADTKQLAVERSLIDAALGGGVTDRTQGIEVGYASQEAPFKAALSFNDGENSKNTDFRDSDGPDATSRIDSNFGVSGRFEYKFFGNWDTYKDLTGKNTKEDTLIAGAGVSFSQNGDADVTRAVVDAQYSRADGWSAFAQGLYVYNGIDDSSNFGIGGQVGYLINPKVEVFGRYSYLNFENDINGQDSFHEITAGANYYFGPDGAYNHNVKFTVDLNYLPTGSPGNQTGVGYLAGDDDQVVLRAQFQLVL
ncbi:MAG: phosphate-selective porin family protein [Phycisphaerales bacterium]|nr:phosphate-selective porin family protein [Phycisphaerales bacterium]